MMNLLLYKITYLAAVTSNCNPNTDNKKHFFFGFPTWWKYIQTGQKDPLSSVCNPVVDFPDGVLKIAFAVVDMLLYLAGIAAVFSIIVAGFIYITSIGNSERATSARKRLQNSLIGLAIVVIAALAVSFIGNNIG